MLEGECGRTAVRIVPGPTSNSVLHDLKIEVWFSHYDEVGTTAGQQDCEEEEKKDFPIPVPVKFRAENDQSQ